MASSIECTGMYRYRYRTGMYLLASGLLTVLYRTYKSYDTGTAGYHTVSYRYIGQHGVPYVMYSTGTVSIVPLRQTEFMPPSGTILDEQKRVMCSQPKKRYCTYLYRTGSLRTVLLEQSGLFHSQPSHHPCLLLIIVVATSSRGSSSVSFGCR